VFWGAVRWWYLVNSVILGLANVGFGVLSNSYTSKLFYTAVHTTVQTFQEL